MAPRSIRWTRRAVRRLDQIGAHISKDSPSSAARVIARIVSAVDLLAKQPAMGRVGRIAQTRELILADIPYIVAYRVTATHVEVLTVMHAAQKWPQEF